MTNPIKISVVVNTKNSESTLSRTLSSVAWVDEIVIVDMQSQDKTVEIARKFTDRVFTHKDMGYVEPARNFAISKARGEWILIVDADEEIPDSLRNAIQEIVDGNQQSELQGDNFFLPRKNIIFGKWIKTAGWWPDRQLRFFRNGSVEWLEEIHSLPITTGVTKEFTAVEDLAIIHHNYQGVFQFIERLNRYSSIQASSSKKGVSQAQLIRVFSDEWLRRLFGWNGIKGDLHEMSLVFLQSFSEIVVLLKKWEHDGFPTKKLKTEKVIESLEQFDRELRYWIADWHVEHSTGIKKMIWQVRRKVMV